MGQPTVLTGVALKQNSSSCVNRLEPPSKDLRLNMYDHLGFLFTILLRILFA
jgi:hypothetical protein